ncbi:hypothetical protein SAY86_009107 [Trapa natans]|uniref:Uncharacterized protein n=1 Tax=Trapa natans TaxID=22666 RepID=A0AAN7QC82_TRANT|nr:hypothetical protein SAY86_009107 [Trapa natans]
MGQRGAEVDEEKAEAESPWEEGPPVLKLRESSPKAEEEAEGATQSAKAPESDEGSSCLLVVATTDDGGGDLQQFQYIS